MIRSSLQKMLMIPAALLLGLCLIAIVPNIAQAGTTDPHGMSKTAEESGLSEFSSDLPTIIGGLIKGLLGLVGIVLLILVIYAGFLWMTAGGNTETVKKAKDTLAAAVIGVLIIFAAYTITTFIVGSVATETGLSTPAETE